MQAYGLLNLLRVQVRGIFSRSFEDFFALAENRSFLTLFCKPVSQTLLKTMAFWCHLEPIWDFGRTDVPSGGLLGLGDNLRKPLCF